MKYCPYCGREYSDDADVCPIDRRPLDTQVETSKEVTRCDIQRRSVFDARVVSYGVSTGVYRIYLRGHDLLFVLIEKGELSKNWDAIAALLGPFGVLIGLLLKSWEKMKHKAAHAYLDDRNAEEVLREDDNNFRLYIPEIRDAVMEPPARFQLSGKQVGRLKLGIHDGRKIQLEFASPDEMRIALCLLSPLLSATLKINVEWDENERRFQKRNDPPP